MSVVSWDVNSMGIETIQQSGHGVMIWAPLSPWLQLLSHRFVPQRATELGQWTERRIDVSDVSMDQLGREQHVPRDHPAVCTWCDDLGYHDCLLGYTYLVYLLSSEASSCPASPSCRGCKISSFLSSCTSGRRVACAGENISARRLHPV